MEKGEKHNNTIVLNDAVRDGEFSMKVDDCAVTLKFPNKPQDSVITEVKRMLLVGHTRKQKHE